MAAYLKNNSRGTSTGNRRKLQFEKASLSFVREYESEGSVSKAFEINCVILAVIRAIDPTPSGSRNEVSILQVISDDGVESAELFGFAHAGIQCGKFAKLVSDEGPQHVYGLNVFKKKEGTISLGHSLAYSATLKFIPTVPLECYQLIPEHRISHVERREVKTCALAICSQFPQHNECSKHPSLPLDGFTQSTVAIGTEELVATGGLTFLVGSTVPTKWRKVLIRGLVESYVIVEDKFCGTPDKDVKDAPPPAKTKKMVTK